MRRRERKIEKEKRSEEEKMGDVMKRTEDGEEEIKKWIRRRKRRTESTKRSENTKQYKMK